MTHGAAMDDRYLKATSYQELVLFVDKRVAQLAEVYDVEFLGWRFEDGDIILLRGDTDDDYFILSTLDDDFQRLRAEYVEVKRKEEEQKAAQKWLADIHLKEKQDSLDRLTYNRLKLKFEGK